MDLKRVNRGEWIAVLGGLLLAIAMFVKSYEARPENPNTNIDGLGPHRGNPDIQFHDATFSYWEVHGLGRWLMLAAALAPLILAYIIARDHQLSWPRGQVTMVVAIAAFGLVFYTGIVDRPGEPSGEIELELGWYGMILGTALMAAGSIMRQSETELKRKPPGTI